MYTSTTQNSPNTRDKYTTQLILDQQTKINVNTSTRNAVKLDSGPSYALVYTTF